MLALLTRRFSLILISAVAIVYLSFLGVNAMGSPRADQPRPAFTEAVVSANEGTISFFTDLARGRMGEVETVSGPRPLGEILWFAYKNSMALALAATLLAALLGVLLGITAAVTRFQLSEFGTVMLAMVGISAPAFLVAVLLQRAGIYLTQTLGYRVVSMGGYAWDFDHLFMPLAVLALRPLAVVTGRTHASLREVLQQDFIRTAFAKGLSRSRTVVVHGLKNLAVPLLTATAISFRFALSTLVIVEFIFAWPGLAFNLLQGVQDREALLVAGCALLLGLTIQLSFLLLDVLYRAFDPRVREQA